MGAAQQLEFHESENERALRTLSRATATASVDKRAAVRTLSVRYTPRAYQACVRRVAAAVAV